MNHAVYKGFLRNLYDLKKRLQIILQSPEIRSPYRMINTFPLSVIWIV